MADVSLLEWSHQLDRHLLQLPFSSLKATSGSRPSLLYKLASSEQRQECGILLLDPDTCTAYYEGISFRTLLRRTDLVAPNGSSGPELERIVEAVHAALQEPLVVSEPVKRNIGWEQSRFSGSLSISITHRDDPDRYRFKTSFDLDPLDHTAQASLLSTHFVRPLLSLANAIAASGSVPDLSSNGDVTASTRSLKLVQRQSLQLLGLPVPHDSSFEAASASPKHSKAPRTEQQSDFVSGQDVAEIDQNDDSDPEDSVFFGPSGVPRPSSSAAKRRSFRTKSSSPTTEIEDAGDSTIIESPKQRSADAKPPPQPPAGPSMLADDDSETEEDDTEVNLSLSRKPASTRKSPTPEVNPASEEKKPEPRPTTPPPPETPSEPTTSQPSPSKTAAQRLEQKRRREEIKRMREAAAADSNSRKRSRF